MGPTNEVAGGVDHAPDYVTAIRSLAAGHPTLTYRRPSGIRGQHTATWDEDDGQHEAAYEQLGSLVRYLVARLHLCPHEAQDGTVYTPAGVPADLASETVYPVEAVCRICHGPVRCDDREAGWVLKYPN